jgi:hypothetical protein
VYCTHLPWLVHSGGACDVAHAGHMLCMTPRRDHDVAAVTVHKMCTQQTSGPNTAGS